jgi:hypothetical protein
VALEVLILSLQKVLMALTVLFLVKQPLAAVAVAQVIRVLVQHRLIQAAAAVAQVQTVALQISGAMALQDRATEEALVGMG